MLYSFLVLNMNINNVMYLYYFIMEALLSIIINYINISLIISCTCSTDFWKTDENIFPNIKILFILILITWLISTGILVVIRSVYELHVVWLQFENKLGFLNFSGIHIWKHSFSDQFLTSIHMKRFHTKINQNRLKKSRF